MAEIPFQSDGRMEMEKANELLDDTIAAILIQSPNFFGIIEDVKALADRAKSLGVLTVMCANPLSYGLFASAGELGADIAVGDTQPFGLPLQFGGPYAGYIACRQELVRQMPGRIVGETVDTKGRRGYVLTLQAREQHIRREKATSNICTNQALAALASLVAMLWYGKQGIPELALTNYRRTAYLKGQFEALGFKTMGNAPFFNECAVHFGCPAEEAQRHFRAHWIEPGLDLGRFYSQLKDFFLIAVTETKGKKQVDRFVDISKSLL
jgi:glycine dehydrogenase subunit 1